MDDALRHKLLSSFPSTEPLGIVRWYDDGNTSAAVYAVQCRALDPTGLTGTYIVKIGSVDWAANEVFLHENAFTGSFAPLLARLRAVSTEADGLRACAYDVAFDQVLRTVPLTRLLDENSGTEREAQRQIHRLCSTLIEGYRSANLFTNATVEGLHAGLLRMLGPKRSSDLLTRLHRYLPDWDQDAQHVILDAPVGRLPNPLAYMHAGAWRGISYQPHCPLTFDHGDLHAGNIVCLPQRGKPPQVIDLGESRSDGIPLFDLAYLEFDILDRTLPVDSLSDRKQWLHLLSTSMSDILPLARLGNGRAARTWGLVRPIRVQVKRLLGDVSHGTDREALEVLWWLATVAVGLNYARKGSANRLRGHRVSALLFAAFGLERLFRTLGYEPNYRQAPVIGWLSNSPAPARSVQSDWDGAPRVGPFYGRAKEISDLRQVVTKDKCQVLTLCGIGGVGKSRLAAALVEEAQEHFDCVIWRSLHNSPPLAETIQDCLQLLSLEETLAPRDEEDGISRFITVLQRRRCIIVLDNFESVMKSGDEAGEYREGREGYGLLLRRAGELPHESCLVLTTREKPAEIGLLEGLASPVRTFQLGGLEHAAGQKILIDKGLKDVGDSSAVDAVIDHYSGNPLALKLVAQFIQEAFAGDIGAFLAEGYTIFRDIRDILDQQFQRLSKLEKDILYWFAIEREPMSASAMQALLIRTASNRRVHDALRSLRRRSWIEMKSPGFSMQNVLLEYVTDRLVYSVCDEVVTCKLLLLASHPLLKAQAKDYIRESQVSLLLLPIVRFLQSQWGREHADQMFRTIIAALRQENGERQGFVAGNVLNLMIQMGYDLGGRDFSNLTVWQAYLEGVELVDTNFRQSDLAMCVFTDTFGSILSLALSAQGGYLAAGTHNGVIRVWQTTTGVLQLACQGHDGWVNSLSFSPDGRLLASGGEDQVIRLWDVETGQCVRTLRGHDSGVRAVAFSPDGRLLASGADDQTVRLWDVETGQNVSIESEHTNRVRSVAFSPDGRLLASGSEDQTVRLWDVETGQNVRTLRGHSHWVRAVAFSPDGRLLASGGEDQVIRLWDAQSGERYKTLRGYTNQVRAVAYSLDGRLLASGSTDQTVRLWDVETGQCVRTLRGHDSGVRAVAFSPDGRLLASGGEDQVIRLWDVETGQCVRTLRGHKNRVWSLSFSSIAFLLASAGADETVRLWDVETGQCVRTLPGHRGEVRAVAFSPDGRLLASGGEDQVIRLWDVETGQCVRTLRGHDSGVRAVAFSPDGRLLASGADDQTVRLWNMELDASSTALCGHKGWVWSVAFSPDGRLLASGADDQTVRLWDVETGQNVFTLHGHRGRVSTVEFAPTESVVATGGTDGTVRLWTLEQRECRGVLLASRPYERMDITDVTGLTETQRVTLQALGATQRQGQIASSQNLVRGDSTK